MVRRELERLYVGRCSITNFQKVFDEKTKRTTTKEVVVVEDEPCRLSFSWNKEAQSEGVYSNLHQTSKLFLRPDLTVLAGSKITVTQSGVTKRYALSGEPAVHTNHQEILLVLDDDKA